MRFIEAARVRDWRHGQGPRSEGPALIVSPAAKRRRSDRWRSIRWAWLLAAALLAGCASTPAPRVEPIVATPSYEPLYAVIGESTAAFQAGLELIRAGSPREGSEAIDAALKDIERAALECAEAPGCESQRFVQALSVLVRLQGVAAGFAEESEDAPPVDEAPALPAPTGEAPAVPMLAGKPLGELIVLNEPVRAALEDWLTWMRPQLIETWVNYQYLRGDMWPVYEKVGLPEALLFGILAKESAGRVHAYSRAGAAGPLQFMPATARRFGLGGSDFDERLDPTRVTQANVAYLREQLGRLGQNLELTLAAYNGGEGRVGRLVKRHPGKSFWSDAIYFALPAETRDYVPKVLAAAYLFLYPERYGLRFPTLTPTLQTYALPSSLSLAELAICLGQGERIDGWFRTLRNANPRIKPELRLPPGTQVRVPAASAVGSQCADAALMARIAALQDAKNPTGPVAVSYTVRRGDTLHAIARRARCTSVAELGRLNGLRAPRYALKVGQKLRLPTCT